MNESGARLSAIAKAAAAVLSRSDYRSMRVEDVAEGVELSGSRRGRPTAKPGRSAVWVYSEVKAKGVLPALAAAHAWQQAGIAGAPGPSDDPQSIEQARSMMTSAFAGVARFCRNQAFLMAQLRAGIGDAASDRARTAVGPGGGRATHETPDLAPEWDDAGPLGVVAREAWHGRSAVFAEYIAERLRVATRAFEPPADPMPTALHLSSLLTFTCTDDPVSSPDVLAAGVEGYWYARYVAGRVPWVPPVVQAEADLRRAEGNGRAPRHLAAAHSALVVELLTTNTLLVRASDAARSADRLITDLLDGPYRTDSPTARDLLELRSDVTSRLGLALHRLGANDEAVQVLRRSAASERDIPDGDGSRAARALTNLADADAAAGRPAHAVTEASEAVAIRTRLYDLTPDPTAWERLTLSRNALVRALATAGRLDDAVRGARQLLADRRHHARGDLLARRTVGTVLREAGHPARAQLELRRAHDIDAPWYLPYSYAFQHLVLELARCAVALGRPEEAVGLLNGSPALDSWFARTVSPALGIEVRLARIEADLAVGSGGQAPAIERLLSDAARDLGARHPVTTDVMRVRAGLLTSTGDAGTAVEQWREIRAADKPLDRGHPKRISTLHGLGIALARAGQAQEAQRTFQQAFALTRHGVGQHHPALLAVRVAAAQVAATDGRVREARELLAPVLDRTPVLDVRRDAEQSAEHRAGWDADCWDLPALEDGHPLLRAARVIDRDLVPGDAGGHAGVERAWWVAEA